MIRSNDSGLKWKRLDLPLPNGGGSYEVRIHPRDAKVGNNVRINGTTFGSSPGTVNFAGADGELDAEIERWADKRIDSAKRDIPNVIVYTFQLEPQAQLSTFMSKEVTVTNGT